MNWLFSGVLPGLLALMAVPFAYAQTDIAGAKGYPRTYPHGGLLYRTVGVALGGWSRVASPAGRL